MVNSTIWSTIETALNNIENQSAYYIGGTLCIDNVFGKIGIGLNRNGRGFTYNTSAKNPVVVMPDNIKTIVNELYMKFKGN